MSDRDRWLELRSKEWSAMYFRVAEKVASKSHVQEPMLEDVTHACDEFIREWEKRFPEPVTPEKTKEQAWFEYYQSHISDFGSPDAKKYENIKREFLRGFKLVEKD